MATYVLIHGGWAGGWEFKPVAQLLRQAGHTAYRPTLTGLGERVHLASPDIDLDTHILDVVNVFKYEELRDVILLGYSYGGMVITGVAEQIPDLIGQLVYLDGYLPDDGQSLADLVGADVMGFLQQAANDHGDGWRIPHFPPDAPLRTDQPVKPGLQPLSVKNPQAAAIQKTFIHCTEDYDQMGPVLTSIIAKAQMAKADSEWQYVELAAAHGSVWETHVAELSEILLGLA